jgi:hypothetical protein
MSFSSPRLYTGVPPIEPAAPQRYAAFTASAAAGQASTRDVLKCALKTVDPKDYNVGFTPTEQAQLSSIFPNGICDYSQPGIGQQPLLGTYLLVQYGYVMPFFGLELLDMARDVAAFNLPARVGQLFGVSL